MKVKKSLGLVILIATIFAATSVDAITGNVRVAVVHSQSTIDSGNPLELDYILTFSDLFNMSFLWPEFLMTSYLRKIF